MAELALTHLILLKKDILILTFFFSLLFLKHHFAIWHKNSFQNVSISH